MWYPARMDLVSTDLTRYKHTHGFNQDTLFNSRQLTPVLQSTAHALMANTAVIHYNPSPLWNKYLFKLNFFAN